MRDMHTPFDGWLFIFLLVFKHHLKMVTGSCRRHANVRQSNQNKETGLNLKLGVHICDSDVCDEGIV